METINLTASPAAVGSKRDYLIRTEAISDGQKAEGGHSVSKLGSAIEDVNAAVDQLKSFVKDAQRNLDFSVDDSSGQFVVRVLDGESGVVIRQIPSEELLRLSEQLENMRSLLFQAEA